MELLKNLELIDVKYENDNKKAVLTFLDEEQGEIREVNFNKQIFEDNKWIDNEEKAEKVEGWCKEFFNLSFDELTKAIGERRDVYGYDNYNSLFETSEVKKFEEDMLGQIIQVVCTEIIDDGKKVAIRFDYEGDIYESKMSYADYNDVRKQWFVNPQKKAKQYRKFEDKFGISIENKEEMIGKDLMVEIKKAMGKWIYADVKTFPKKKK